jgi:hypothetical protein
MLPLVADEYVSDSLECEPDKRELTLAILLNISTKMVGDLCKASGFFQCGVKYRI